MQRKGQGFTLIEMIVVVAIIGLLAATAGISFARQQEKARDGRRQADISNIQTALSSFMAAKAEPATTHGGASAGYTGYLQQDCGRADESSMNNGVATPGTAVTNTFMTFLKSEGYMTTVPIDPLNDFNCVGGEAWKNGYAYEYYYYTKETDGAAWNIKNNRRWYALRYHSEGDSTFGSGYYSSGATLREITGVTIPW